MISTILAFIDNYPEACVGICCLVGMVVICCLVGMVVILIGGLSDGGRRR